MGRWNMAVGGGGGGGGGGGDGRGRVERDGDGSLDTVDGSVGVGRGCLIMSTGVLGLM